MKQSVFAKPTLNAIVACLIAILLFSTVSIMIYVQAEGIKSIDEASKSTIVLISFFLCFAIAGFLSLLSVKTIELDHRELIIHRIFPFKTKVYATSDIINIEQKDYLFQTATSGSTYKIHEGYETIIGLRTGKVIKMNTYQFENYNSFNNQIQAIFSNRIDLPKFRYFERQKFEGLGWLVFFIAIEGFFVYEIIEELTGV
jgi:hypothetical protein